MKKIQRPLRLIGIMVIATGAMFLMQLMVLGQDQAAMQEVEVAPAAVTGQFAGVQEAVQVVRQTAHFTTTAVNFTDLPNATTEVIIPAGHIDLLIIRFFAESVCSGGGRDYCKVQILVDGVEADPAVGTEFAFDSTNEGADGTGSWEAHAMERSRCVVAGDQERLVTVKVQWATSNPATTFRLDDWSLSVERSHDCG